MDHAHINPKSFRIKDESRHVEEDGSFFTKLLCQIAAGFLFFMSVTNIDHIRGVRETEEVIVSYNTSQEAPAARGSLEDIKKKNERNRRKFRSRKKI